MGGPGLACCQISNVQVVGVVDSQVVPNTKTFSLLVEELWRLNDMYRPRRWIRRFDVSTKYEVNWINRCEVMNCPLSRAPTRLGLERYQAEHPIPSTQYFGI